MIFLRQPIWEENNEDQHRPHPHHPHRQPAAPRRSDRADCQGGEAAIDPAAFDRRVVRGGGDRAAAVEAGIDVVNDGEAGKPGYSTYVKDRLTGFGGEAARPNEGEARTSRSGPRGAWSTGAAPRLQGPVAWKDRGAVREIDNLKAAVAAVKRRRRVHERRLARRHRDLPAQRVLPQPREVHRALAGVMREEYNAIVNAGFVLQLDCPDLAMTRHNRHIDKTLAEFRDICKLHVEAINEATKDIPPERCACTSAGATTKARTTSTSPLTDIIDIVLKAHRRRISLRGRQPASRARVERLAQDVELPDGKVVIPGVIDSTTNFIEHPELVAQRIEQLRRVSSAARTSSPARTAASAPSQRRRVDHRIAWAKLKSLAEGAAIASKTLWQ